MIFMATLLSTGYDATHKTLVVNYLIFIGVPLACLLGYTIYAITKNDLVLSTEFLRFIILVVVPLILSYLYVTYGGKL